MRLKTLQTKILVLLIPLIVVPLLALGWIAYSMLMDVARHRAEDQMTTMLEQIRLQTEFQLRTARANASLFASTESVRRFVRDGWQLPDISDLEREVQELLFSYQIAYPEYYEIRIVSPNGREMLRSTLGKIGNQTDDESSTDYFIASSNKSDTIHAEFFRNPDNNKPALLTSKPLFYPAGDSDDDTSEPELFGYMMLTVDLGFLKKHAFNRKIGESSRVFFTDAAGNILFRKKGSGTPKQLPAGLFKTLKTGIANNQPVEAEYNTETARFMGMQLDNWLYMFTSYPEHELLAKRNSLGITVTLITSISILITMALLFGALKTFLLVPIRKLSFAAKAIGKGKLQVDIDVSSSDEIGDLARSFREMSESLSHYHEQVRYVAYHDSLTGLPNRMMFRDYLNRATAEARRNQQELAILFLDLDNFKRINDTLGHQAGDKMLSAFADRLSGCLRESDVVSHTNSDDASNVVARLAGDEFIILLPQISGSAAAQKVARRILESLSEAFVIDQQEMHVTSSIGIALYPDDGENSSDLMKNADIAMYSAKKLGRNNYQYYSRKMNDAAVRKLEIESRLRRAVENGELELHYQPQMNLDSGRITGVESLLRWTDAEMGKVSPEVFVPIAEEYGLIVPISEWVIHEACRQAQTWQTMYSDPINMSINVSAVHFNGQELESLIARTLQRSGLNPNSLELELTETGILHDPELAIATMKAFKDMGVKISLDDFGTGYSSLSYVMNLPIDKLKIDRSFILNMEKDKRGSAIVSAIIAMAHTLGLTVIAEGVETKSHLQLLKTMHCDMIQGFYIAHAMPASEFEDFLDSPEQRHA
ncbi:MAG: EAL domain-containing protein [Pseudomonadota bacterium]